MSKDEECFFIPEKNILSDGKYSFLGPDISECGNFFDDIMYGLELRLNSCTQFLEKGKILKLDRIDCQT